MNARARTLEGNESFYERIIGIIERGAAKAARTHLGHSPGERLTVMTPRHDNTPEVKAKALALIKEGKLTIAEICRQSGSYYQYVHRMASQMGADLPKRYKRQGKEAA